MQNNLLFHIVIPGVIIDFPNVRIIGHLNVRMLHEEQPVQLNLLSRHIEKFSKRVDDPSVGLQEPTLVSVEKKNLVEL